MTKSKKKIWMSGVAVLATIVIVYWLTYRNRRTFEITYREIQVSKENIAVTILATGTVQPENRLDIKPPVAGRIEQVLIKEGQKVKKGQILAWMSSTERAALLDAARAQGTEEIKKWEENYRATPILAPINGTIILRNVESGQTFTATDSVFTMSDRLTVKAQVDETDIAQIKLKQKAKIVLDAYSNKLIPGHVEQIAFDAKTVNNVTTYDVDVLPEEIPEFMRSGMTTNVTFLIAAKDNVIAVPNDALKVQENKYSVMIKESPDASLKPREVQIGLTDGKRTEITGGLNEGDTIMVAEMKASEMKAFKDKSQQNSNPFSPVRVGGRGGR